jgi:hypothetical protein
MDPAFGTTDTIRLINYFILPWPQVEQRGGTCRRAGPLVRATFAEGLVEALDRLELLRVSSGNLRQAS